MVMARDALGPAAAGALVENEMPTPARSAGDVESQAATRVRSAATPVMLGKCFMGSLMGVYITI
jgi:hypothetical protein